MSCMEHTCKKCNYTTFDNKAKGNCPKCGSAMTHHFDEDDDYKAEDYEHKQSQKRYGRNRYEY